MPVSRMRSVTPAPRLSPMNNLAVRSLTPVPQSNQRWQGTPSKGDHLSPSKDNLSSAFKQLSRSAPLNQESKLVPRAETPNRFRNALANSPNSINTRQRYPSTGRRECPKLANKFDPDADTGPVMVKCDHDWKLDAYTPNPNVAKIVYAKSNPAIARWKNVARLVGTVQKLSGSESDPVLKQSITRTGAAPMRSTTYTQLDSLDTVAADSISPDKLADQYRLASVMAASRARERAAAHSSTNKTIHALGESREDKEKKELKEKEEAEYRAKLKLEAELKAKQIAGQKAEIREKQQAEIRLREQRLRELDQLEKERQQQDKMEELEKVQEELRAAQCKPRSALQVYSHLTISAPPSYYPESAKAIWHAKREELERERRMENSLSENQNDQINNVIKEPKIITSNSRRSARPSADVKVILSRAPTDEEISSPQQLHKPSTPTNIVNSDINTPTTHTRDTATTPQGGYPPRDEVRHSTPLRRYHEVRATTPRRTPISEGVGEGLRSITPSKDRPQSTTKDASRPRYTRTVTPNRENARDVARNNAKEAREAARESGEAAIKPREVSYSRLPTRELVGRIDSRDYLDVVARDSGEDRDNLIELSNSPIREAFKSRSNTRDLHVYSREVEGGGAGESRATPPYTRETYSRYPSSTGANKGSISPQQSRETYSRYPSSIAEKKSSVGAIKGSNSPDQLSKETYSRFPSSIAANKPEISNQNSKDSLSKYPSSIADKKSSIMSLNEFVNDTSPPSRHYIRSSSGEINEHSSNNNLPCENGIESDCNQRVTANCNNHSAVSQELM
eukprot:GHVR01026280.1.p1 GENE.GHVR01026280.1~~GHVR01026280.1.p1  ORF type:complete len:797 (+),score=178.40 GHVR01026280.1:49-2439(+)